MVKEKVVLMLSDFDLDNPSGAAWSRVSNYANALRKENVKCILLSARYNYQHKCEIIDFGHEFLALVGVKLEYRSTFEDFHFLRYWKFLKEIVRMDFGPNDMIYLLYNNKLNSVLMTLLYLVLVKRKRVYVEKNELQYAIAKNIDFKTESFIRNQIGSLYRLLRISTGFLADLLSFFFTGVVAISTRFEQLYRRVKVRVIRIPILVNSEINVEEQLSLIEQDGVFRIGYFGFISEEKDGVLSLINAVKSTVLKSGRELELHLYGSMATYDQGFIKKEIDGSIIIYHGSISSAAVSQEMMRFNALALIRPENLQTQFGFSTKLGEYLLSAVPVLTSNVSDNGIYLTNGRNAFILKGGPQLKVESIEELLLGILNLDKKSLEQIGRNGREIALAEFDYKVHSSRLSNFFYS